MSNNGGPLSFEATLDDSDYNRRLARMQSQTGSFTQNLAQESAKLDSLFKNLGVTIAAAFTFQKAEQFVGDVIKIRGQFQQLDIAFTSMLQSKSKANDLMGQLITTAATTPFSLTEVAQGAKQLIAYGTGADMVNDTIKRLGNVASGLSVPLNDLIYLYGTLQSQGRAYAMDIRQFAGRGIPIYEGLSKVLGVTKDKVAGLVEAGKVGFPEVEKVFQNLTNAGGMFYNLMQESSKSLSGQVSNLGDAWDVMLNKIGQSNEGALSGGIELAAELVEHYDVIGKTLGVLITTYGAFKAATIAVSLVQGAAAMTNEVFAASVTSESSAIAQNIALKLDNAQTTAIFAASIATETAARAANLEAIAAQTRAEFIEVAAKETLAAENVVLAASAVAEAEIRLAAAKLTAQGVATAEEQIIAVKAVAIAQNELLVASEAEVTAKKVLSSASADVNAKKHFLDVVAKEASTVANVANAASEAATTAAINVEVIARQRVTIGTILQSKAQAALNLVMNANPYVLVATALIGLVTASYLFHDGTTNAQKAQKAFNEEMEKSKKVIDDLKTKTSELTSILNNNSSTEFQRVVAYKQLQQLYPQLLGSMSQHEFSALSAEAAQKKLNAAMDAAQMSETDKIYKKASDAVDVLQKKVDQLTKTNYSEVTNSQLDILRNRLEQAKIEAYKAKDAVDAQNNAAAEAAEQERVKALPLQDQIAYYRQIKSELSVQVETVEKSRIGVIGVGEVVDMLTGKVHQTGNAFGNIQTIIDGLSFNSLKDRLKSASGSLEALLGKDEVKNKSYYTDIKKKNEDALAILPMAGRTSEQEVKWKEYSAAIKDADEKLAAYNITADKAKKLKKIDIVLPFGSEAEYARLIKKTTDILSKTPTDQIQRVKDLQSTIERLTEQHAEAKRLIEVRSWAEMLDYKEKEYAKFNLAISSNDKDVTDQMSIILADKAPEIFKDLLADGKSYYAFLVNQMEPLQSKLANNTITKQEYGKLALLTAKTSTLKGISSPEDDYKIYVEKLKETTGNTADYIQILRDKLSALSAIPEKDLSDYQIKQMAILRDGIKTTTQEQAQALKAFLVQVQGSEAQRQSIIDKYAGLRKQAEDEGKPKLSINKAEIKELQEFAFESSKEWKKLNKTIEGEGTAALDKYIESLKEALFRAQMELGENNDKTKQLSNELSAAMSQKQDIIIQNWTSVADSIGQVASELQGMEGVLGAIGSLFAGAAGEANDFEKNIKLASKNTESIKLGNGADTGNTIAAAIKGLSDLSSLLINSIEKKKSDKKTRELDAVNYQVEMNKALNEEIRLRTILSENIYFKDYAGRIKDSISAASDAVTKYNKALLNLEDNGKSLTGTKNEIDWSNVGKGALSGASTGAVIGSAVPVIGTVVGAVVGSVVGGIVGLISTKTKSLYGPLLRQYPDLINSNGELNKSLAETLINTNQVSDQTKLWLQDLINASDAMEEARKQITDIVSELTGSLGTELRDVLVGAFESGTDAAYNFAKTVKKTLENALSNIIYSAIFSKAFSNLQADLENSLLGLGKSFAEVFADFLAQSKDLTNSFNDAMKAAQEEGKKAGFNLFDNSDPKDANSLSGAIQGVTENTANILSGQLNAIRVNQAASLNIMSNQLPNLSLIASHTIYLISIDRRLAKAYDQSQRPFGVYEGP